MDLDDYLSRHAGQDEVLARVERETNALPAAGMLTRPTRRALLTLLVRAIGGARAIEIGTFTGYGAICIARGLPADGTLTIYEVAEEYAAIARRNLEAARRARQGHVRHGPART